MRQLMKRPGSVRLLCLGLCVAAVCSESSAQSDSKGEPVASPRATTSSADTAKTTNSWRTRPTLPPPVQRPGAGTSGPGWKTKMPSNLGTPAVPRITAIDAAKVQCDNLQRSAIELKRETAKLQKKFDDAFGATQLLLTKSHEAEERYETFLSNNPPDLENGSPEELKRARLKAESTAATKLYNVAFKKETELAGELTVRSSEADILARKIQLAKAKLDAEANYAAAQGPPVKADLARRKAELDAANKALAEDAARDAEDRKYPAELAAEEAKEKERRNRNRGSQTSTNEGGFKSATIVEAENEATPQQPAPIPPPVDNAARKRAGKLRNNAQELAERVKSSADYFDDIDLEGDERSKDYERLKRAYEEAEKGPDVSPEQLAKLKARLEYLSKEIDNVLRKREEHFNSHQRALKMAEEAEQKAKQTEAGAQQAQRLKDLAEGKPRVANGGFKRQAVEDTGDLSSHKDEGVSDEESRQKVFEPSTADHPEESTHANEYDDNDRSPDVDDESDDEMTEDDEVTEDDEMTEDDDEVDTMDDEDEEMSAEGEVEEEMPGDEDEEESSAEGDDEEMSEDDDEMSAEDQEVSEDNDEEEMSEEAGGEEEELPDEDSEDQSGDEE